MTLTYLIVIGISGVFCYEAETVGACLRTPNGRLCIAHETDLPLFLSVYDPEICNEHLTNCLDPANAWQSATGSYLNIIYMDGLIGVCGRGTTGIDFIKRDTLQRAIRLNCMFIYRQRSRR